ncbi:S49 family peptidase [Rikenella microfusus]|uniref:S49 family peptidase n=1 Tax=Rikenella microfusus TaxID=28139 RepID=UPI00248D61E4|nr:S49 family peptidase [Rikenella microfusus]
MVFSLARLIDTHLLVEPKFLDRFIVDHLLHANTPLPAFDWGDVVRSLPTLSESDIAVTFDLSEVTADKEFVFYHPIAGMILSHPSFYYDWGYGWREMFSTTGFLNNLKAADALPNVLAHFLHINSGGGIAWLLDVAAAAMRECKKPIYAFIEYQCCSAAYYLASQATVIKAFTRNDTIGSIGTMVSGINLDGYYEQLGIKVVEAYATRSDLKNKKENDLLAGKPEEFITTRLDPLQQQFETNVRAGRPQLNDLSDDHPVFRGETFFASEAQELGLIDGILPDLSAALREAYDLGVSVRDSNQISTNI